MIQPGVPPLPTPSFCPHLWGQQRAVVDGRVACHVEASQEGGVQVHHVAVQTLHRNGLRLRLLPQLQAVRGRKVQGIW